MSDRWDVVVVGAGPNGLAAGVALAQAGRSVLILEAADGIGGGTRTSAVTLEGFAHDICSAVHPLGAASPFLSGLPLERHGLRWVHHEVALAHPLDGGRAGLLHRSLDATAEGLGADARAWRRHIGALVRAFPRAVEGLLGPILKVPNHPLAMARFGVPGALPATTLARMWFDTDEARALVAGNAAHSFLPLTAPFTSALGLALMVPAHLSGWPIAEGGSQRITEALAGLLSELGGEIRCGVRVRSLADLPAHGVALFDTSPRALASIAGDVLPAGVRNRYERFRYGPGSFKIDYALSGPVPWTNPDCARASTVHVGGTIDEVAAGEAEVVRGGHPDRPFVLVAQPSIADPTRAPAGRHTLWVYCHVPSGSTVDMTERIENQIERFAPGWRDVILARSVRGPAELEAENPNYVGGDIAGGSTAGLQLLARPGLTAHPYATGNPALWLCSASTPPGGGVHGMCGYWAAQAVLRS